MQLTDLPNETLLQIYLSLPTISSCHALASTSHHLHSLLHSSHRLPILYSAASTQYGPLPDAIRLVTHTITLPAHTPRPSPPLTLPLLRQILSVGRTANAWASLYPFHKWRGPASASRRLLTSSEQFALRRACYRLWLYTLSFHNPAHSRTTRLSPPVVRTRAALLRPWPTAELAEMLDLQGIFRQALHSTVCPSNSTVLRRHRNRYPDDPFPLVAVTHRGKWVQDDHAASSRPHLYASSFLYPPPRYELGLSNQRSRKDHHHHHHQQGNAYGMASEGWGDEIAHYYVVEDMLKLDPGQLMYLYQVISEGVGSAQGGFNAGWSSKGMVEGFLEEVVGPWFDNNGETLGETVGFVVGERGGDAGEVREGVEGGWGWGVCWE